MNAKVREFMLTNKNNGVKWKIDGTMFEDGYMFIPEYLLEKYVFDWVVNQWEGIIEITTECH